MIEDENVSDTFKAALEKAILGWLREETDKDEKLGQFRVIPDVIREHPDA